MTTHEKKRRTLASAAAAIKSVCEAPDNESLPFTTKRARSSGPSSASGPSEPAFALESIQARARAVTALLLNSDTNEVDAVCRHAKVHFLTSDRASWVFHVPRWYRQVFSEHSPAPGSQSSVSRGADRNDAHPPPSLGYSRWLDQVWELHPEHHDSIMMFGRAIPTPRFQQAYAVSYRFSGNTFEAKPVPEILQHCVTAMQDMVLNSDTNASFLRGVLVNWYADGEHYIGPHSDSEGALFKHSPVFSLSLGATRRFIFTAKATKSSSSVEANVAVDRLELELEDGDLVVMGGTTQQTHKHALPKMKKCLKKRVSITLRCFK